MTTEQSSQTHSPVTLKDIAERCGVGVPTVSRALRDPNRFSKALTERIYAVAAELGYDPMRQDWARRMSLRRHGKRVINHLIALAFPGHFYNLPYYTGIFQGIIDVLTPAGFNLLLLNVDDIELYPLSPSISRGDVDGVIVHESLKRLPGVIGKLNAEPSLADRPILTLFIDWPECLSVQVDYKQGAYAAAKHLLQQGHRHLLVIADIDEAMVHCSNDPFNHRLQGYRQAFQEQGLNPDEYLHYLPVNEELYHVVIKNPPEVNVHAIPYHAHKQIDWLRSALQANPDITAILAINDLTATLLKEMLQLQGLRVPEDISLIGFDDTVPFIDHVTGENHLTTIQVPLHEVGMQAANLLLSHITNPKTPETSTVLPTVFRERDTVIARK
ncbi:MAG TPA: LacI family DNA-binding transcriptional regulator [Armatimonadota bacterium]|nr:LacI family DNA-binding transcriptional regulator [Armatimonadota bacterium]